MNGKKTNKFLPLGRDLSAPGSLKFDIVPDETNLNLLSLGEERIFQMEFPPPGKEELEGIPVEVEIPEGHSLNVNVEILEVLSEETKPDGSKIVRFKGKVILP